MYGQILRRMPLADDPVGRFAVVVPEEGLKAALRVPQRVRELLRIEVYTVNERGHVSPAIEPMSPAPTPPADRAR
jgi:hypothetical protein